MSEKQQRNHWIGFDLGGTKMMPVLYDGKFRAIGWKKKKTKGNEGMKSCIERIIKTIHNVIEEGGLVIGDIQGIGFGLPGVLNLDKGIVQTMPNLGWKNVKLKKIIEDEFGCQAHIINDVDSGLYGEFKFGAARGARCAIGLFAGTGIGGACLYEGKIIRGKVVSCMEIGHTVVNPIGPRCGCGNRGCLEALAGRLAISSHAARLLYMGEAPHLSTIAGTDVSGIKSSALAASIEGGDESVERIIRDAAQWIGLTVANLVSLLSPDRVILGGGLVTAMPDLFKEEIESTAKAHLFSTLKDSFKIEIAELGDDATAMGAAAWARERVESEANG